MMDAVILKKFRQSSASISSCGLSYSDKAKKYIVGDCLGDVYILNEKLTVEKDLTTSVNDDVVSATVSPMGDLCAITKGKVVSLCRFPDVTGECMSTLVRCTLPVTQVAFDQGGQKVFSAAEEPGISVSVLDPDDYSAVARTFKVHTHDSGVKSFALHPEGSLLAYVDASCNLFITALKFSGNALVGETMTSDMVHQTSGAVSERVVRDAKVPCRLAWHPTEVVVAVPGVRGCVSLLRRITDCDNTGSCKWEESFITHPDQGHGNDDVSVVLFSPCGNLLISLDVTGMVVVWAKINSKYEPRRKIWAQSEDASLARVTDLCWGGAAVVLSSATECGCVDLDAAALCRASADASDADADVHLATGREATQARRETAKASVATHSCDNSELDSVVKDQNLHSPAVPATKSKRLQRTGGAGGTADDDYTDLDIMVDEGSISKIKAITSAVNNSDHISGPGLGPLFDDDDDTDPDEDSPGGPAQGKPEEGMGNLAVCMVHPSVSVACTRPDEKQRRYLVWNATGVITSREEIASNRIEIRFSDSNKHRNEVFADNFGFTRAWLGSEGAVMSSEPVAGPALSAEGQSVGGAGSTLYYHAFSQNGSGRRTGDVATGENWTHTLPVGEAVLGLSCGLGWVAAATSTGLLRFFSTTGLQLSVTWLSGPPVCLCGSMVGDVLAVITNAGMGAVGGYRLEYQLWRTANGDRYEPLLPVGGPCPVPLSWPCNGSAIPTRLEWAALAVDTQCLCTLDSTGILSMHITRTGAAVGSNYSVPVLDIHQVRKSPDHKYWPVMVRGSKLAFVLLNGENKPAIHPQPIVSTRVLQMPLLAGGLALGTKGLDEIEVVNKCQVDELLLKCLEEGAARAELTGDAGWATRLGQQRGEADRAMLKLFQELCRHQRAAQALDLAMRLHTDVALQAAIAIANHFSRPAIAAQLESRRELLLAAEQESEAIHQQPLDQAPLECSPTESTHSQSVLRDSQQHYQDEAEHVYPNDDLMDHQYSSDLLGKRAKVERESTSLSRHTTAMALSGRPVNPLNPFQRSTISSPERKKASTLAGLQALQASPSPSRPAIAISSISLSPRLLEPQRQSIAAQDARQKRDGFAKKTTRLIL